MNKIIKVITNPKIIIKKIYWSCKKKKFGKIGKQVSFGNNLKILGIENVFLGNNVVLGNNVKIENWKIYNNNPTGYEPKILVGNDVIINDNCFISCLNKIEIGNGVLFGENVFITDNFHGHNTIEEANIPPSKRELYSKGIVEIGNNVWIGRNVCIMPNVKIGDNVVIGANAVVTHDIESNTIVGGVPAKVIKKI